MPDTSTSSSSRVKRAVSCGGKCAPQGRPSGVLIRSAGQQRARSLASRRRGRGRESRNAMYVQPLKHTFHRAWWSKSNCNFQHPCRWASSRRTQLGKERCREPTPNLLGNRCSVKRAHGIDNSNDKCPHRLERLGERRRQTVRLLAGEPTSGCWSPEIGLDPTSDGGRSNHARRGLCCAGSAGTGERALRVSVDAALRAGIFKALGSFDPMGFWDGHGS